MSVKCKYKAANLEESQLFVRRSCHATSANTCVSTSSTHAPPANVALSYIHTPRMCTTTQAPYVPMASNGNPYIQRTQFEQSSYWNSENVQNVNNTPHVNFAEAQAQANGTNSFMNTRFYNEQNMRNDVQPNSIYASYYPNYPFANAYLQNPFSKVSEVVTLLPEFDPSSETSLNANQFVKRIEMLRAAYQWGDQVLLFAVQQKLKGYAKFWIDGQCIFKSWSEFVAKFCADFSRNENVADIHIKMN
ncbi:PREDICTED: uncharacterized protein LOC108361771 [Rhagoletis zephyria]|uniref:uncharacterized protein LOC108361771 n=1 Tax=Rhagoletis zephyria TaxID=28612 RepID=UPI0008117B51|nr:PREDICTED: uncharacterized protein LOC108361771 [Rhagoletis zephyria]XP_017470010.1 PREDICTED: uncharacterized protein LOC108361771 [Rhagoletis zephyria]